MGLANDLKKVSKEMVIQRQKLKGEPLDLIYVNKNGYSLSYGIKTIIFMVFPVWINFIFRGINYYIIY